MDRLSPFDRVRIILRSLFVQVFLNYRTMQGPGCLFSLWPWLKNSEHRKARVARASGYMNGHPVFSAFALGAMLRRLGDGDGEANPREFDQWRESLGGPMGVIGDGLIWERWKPIVFTLGACAVLLTSSITLWWVIAAICLLLYNLPLFLFRGWALVQGFHLGKELLSLSGHPALQPLRKRLDLLAALTAGLVLAVAATRSALPDLPNSVRFAAAFLCVIGLTKLRMSIAISLWIALLVSLATRFFIF